MNILMIDVFHRKAEPFQSQVCSEIKYCTLHVRIFTSFSALILYGMEFSKEHGILIDNRIITLINYILI